MSKKHHSKPVVQTIEDDNTISPEEVVEQADAVSEVVAEQEEIETVSTVRGSVVDCYKLNVRRAPSTNSAVVCEIPRGTVVIIDESKSKNDWYSVCIESGIEGFCMKKYIAIS